MFRRIVVGVDESKAAQAALHVAADMARRYQATLILVHVYGPVPRYLGPDLYDTAAAKARTHGMEVLGRISAIIEGVTVETDLLEGPTADALLRAIETHKGDLIIIGSRGLGEMSGLALGSVGHRLIQQAPVPLMIVKKLPKEE
jgi:nucleotide-binding universal stress UspA family protein